MTVMKTKSVCWIFTYFWISFTFSAELSQGSNSRTNLFTVLATGVSSTESSNSIDNGTNFYSTNETNAKSQTVSSILQLKTGIYSSHKQTSPSSRPKEVSNLPHNQVINVQTTTKSNKVNKQSITKSNSRNQGGIYLKSSLLWTTTKNIDLYVIDNSNKCTDSGSWDLCFFHPGNFYKFREVPPLHSLGPVVNFYYTISMSLFQCSFN